MNSVNLIGRLTKDPEVRYTGNQMAVAKFNLAINRQVKDGQEKKADFPSIIVFGKTAENCERFLSKGKLAGISGRIQTGSYKDKEGKSVYTTEVIAERVEFLEWGDKAGSAPMGGNPMGGMSDVPEGFAALTDDDDIPF